LHIVVVQAKCLIAADRNGFSDPYCIVQIDEGKVSEKTRTIKKSLEPVWNQEFRFKVKTVPVVHFIVMDWDLLVADDPLGKVDLDIASIQSDQDHELWLDLKNVPSGQLNVKVRFNPVARFERVNNRLRFFNEAKQKRNYMVIVDRSGSMEGSNWKQAQEAVEKIAPFASVDGITLFFFSSGHPTKYEKVLTTQQVQDLFKQEKPHGWTDLDAVLQMALNDHFEKKQTTTVLIITDGKADQPENVKNTLIDAASRVKSDSDLSISFIQVGNNEEATHFLKFLDDGLRSTYDIVDTLSFAKMKGMSFLEIVQNSLVD